MRTRPSSEERDAPGDQVAGRWAVVLFAAPESDGKQVGRRNKGCIYSVSPIAAVCTKESCFKFCPLPTVVMSTAAERQTMPDKSKLPERLPESPGSYELGETRSYRRRILSDLSLSVTEKCRRAAIAPSSRRRSETPGFGRAPAARPAYPALVSNRPGAKPMQLSSASRCSPESSHNLLELRKCCPTPGKPRPNLG